MKNIAFLILVILAVALGCKTKTNKLTGSSKSKSVVIKFQSKSGSHVSGDAAFVEKNGNVTFTAKMEGLQPGIHAIHIHERADCSADDASSAGGHWNPTFKKHGKWGDVEHHKGDIGNFTTDEFGNGSISMSTTEWCIGCGDKSKDILGKGLIIHEKADDYITQPTGDAGGRVACTAIIQ